MSFLRNETSSLSSSNNSSDVDVEMASFARWQRVRTVVLAIRSTTETVKFHQAQLREDGDLFHLVEAHRLTNEIRNHEIMIARYHKALERLKRITTKKRMTLVKAREEADEEVQLKMKKKLANLAVVHSFASNTLDKRRQYLFVYTQLVRARRRALIKEIADIFSLTVETVSNAKNECSCNVYQSICGVHLPLTRDFAGHSEEVIAAAYGHTAHFLESLSILIDYIYRYPISSAASTSAIHSRKDSKSLPLHGTRWRSARLRLDQALNLLGENVSQLMEDTGFATDWENILRAIHFWVEAVLNGNVPILFSHRPTKSTRSPAGLLCDEEELPITETTLTQSNAQQESDNVIIEIH
ncbi:unnamed protein product [Nippostrongylus brasiliensis]|uniref:Uncharacterized protein n=1 Tax=Nippostrongylus brasiliensis TaxID=27835 RepID=A0A158QZ93_NIPBR|nr:unnamed protein product [Nippostrongylus brasiliensis]